MDNALSEDQAANITGGTRLPSGSLAGDAKTRVEELVSQGTAAAEHAYGLARNQVREAATVVARSAEQQPLITLLIAGFVCGAVGYLLARR
jgi:hypothetical protein